MFCFSCHSHSHRRQHSESGREATLRRSAEQLQQTCASRGECHRRADGAHQAKAIATDWCQSKESNNDHKSVGGAILVRLQAQMGAQGVWRRRDAARSIRSHLAAGHSALQQVSSTSTNTYTYGTPCILYINCCCLAAPMATSRWRWPQRPPSTTQDASSGVRRRFTKAPVKLMSNTFRSTSKHASWSSAAGPTMDFRYVADQP